MAHLVAPSILSADFGHLERDAAMVDASEADWFHVDVMDGVFVPNISFGFPILEVLDRCSDKYMDVHLMTSRPEPYIGAWKRAGADGLTVHAETVTHLHACVANIREAGMSPGVAVNPATPLSALEEILPHIDLALVMSVDPGFGGQAFIPASLDKIRRLRDLADRLNPRVRIEVDGGVKPDNAAEVIRAGADVIVSGSGVFGAENPAAAIAALKRVQPDTQPA